MEKIVKADSTFLWKKNEMNPVLEKIEGYDEGALRPITDEEAMKLYEDDLVESELLYGDVVEVVSEADGWSQVIALNQASHKGEKGYPGWVRKADLTDYQAPAAAIGRVAVIKPDATLHLTAEKSRQLPFGVILPLVGEREAEYVVATPDGEGWIAKEDTQRADQVTDEAFAPNLLRLAKQFLSLPYVWAGTSGKGFDCSGFSYSLYRVNGITIPRDADDQAVGGQQITYEEAQPGDLLYFAYEKGKGAVHHVGIYEGNDRMIHSQTPGSKVIETTIPGSKYEEELSHIVRYK